MVVNVNLVHQLCDCAVGGKKYGDVQRVPIARSSAIVCDVIAKFNVEKFVLAKCVFLQSVRYFTVCWE